MNRKLTPAENYIVCAQLSFGDIPPGSVKEPCFACGSAVAVYPNSQRLIQEHPESKLKIVCTSCYMTAPDKDRIEPRVQRMPEDIAAALRVGR